MLFYGGRRRARDAFAVYSAATFKGQEEPVAFKPEKTVHVTELPPVARQVPLAGNQGKTLVISWICSFRGSMHSTRSIL